MAGILYNGQDGYPRYSARNGQTYRIALPPGINHPINICSCSHGLVVFHDPISNIYYIGNPGYPPDSYIPLPQTPRQHDPQHTHVVLATEILDPPIYHLVCVLEDLTPTTYTVDTYSSAMGRWLSWSGLDIEAHIIPNTGVSCNAFAYWLTESPRSLFRFNIYSPLDSSRLWFTNDVTSSVPETRIQLGRIGNTVALLSVSVEASHDLVMKLCLIQNGWWRIFSVEPPIPIRCWPIPRPIRFNGVDVFFWADGQLMLLNGRTGLLHMLNEEGVRAADAIAYVSSTLRPQDFPAAFRQNDDE